METFIQMIDCELQWLHVKFGAIDLNFSNYNNKVYILIYIMAVLG